MVILNTRAMQQIHIVHIDTKRIHLSRHSYKSNIRTFINRVSPISTYSVGFDHTLKQAILNVYSVTV
ncbi:hypothetical protein [Fibrobacter sp. UWH3]|nr:hypothetical protein [Fibrobacter sp. UWH3]